MRRLILVFQLLTLALVAAGRAQDVSVRALVSQERVFVGDSVLLAIEVEGSDSPQRPQLPDADGLQITFVDEQNTSTLIYTDINGRRSEEHRLSYSFRYRVAPTTAGTHRIPPALVRVGNGEHSTQPIWLVAEAPQEVGDFKLRVSLSKERLYVGEAATLTLTWYVGARAGALALAAPGVAEAFDVFPPIDAKASVTDPNREIEVEFLGERLVATIAADALDGRSYQAVTIRRVVVAREPGLVQVGPITAVFDRVGETNRNRRFSPLGPTPTDRIAIPSNELSVEVLPLPEAGKPANFSGLVGAFTLTSAASPVTVNVGDPIELTLRIMGSEPLHAVGPPDLAGSAIADGFRLSTDGWTAEPAGVRGQRTFSTTIRARASNITSIPPVELDYFDSSAGQYRVARSKEIPLTVRPTRVVTLDTPTTSGSAGAAASTRPEPLRDAPPGIMANHADLGLAPTLAQSPLTTGALALALGAPPMVAIAMAWRARLDTRSPRSRVHRAVRLARSAHRAGDGARAVRELAGALRDQPASTITSHDAAAAILDATGEPELAAIARDVLASRDRRDFGPAGGAAPAPQRDVARVINGVRRTARRSA